MKNNNRRSFFPLLLAAFGAACLLPRKAVGKVFASGAGASAAAEAEARALAALIRKAPHSVAYSPGRRRDSGTL